ncbi:endonuclease-reverse transcriptase [Elysia marginata]|uniref:Endonuclease-reverse transcriptase n=1 Tax=Elysia marginata TaxID=1093978 RepID=A0AAV4J0F1_9GAST|nr:endonuclease-reverse transcriptase [Elysia marginata]
MTYGCQTWSMTKAVGQKLRVAQRAMEGRMLGLKLTDKISCKEIRNKTQVSDIAQYIAKQKWKWAGHVARLQDNRWTLRVTEWQPRNGKRSRGRQARRWRDDIVRTMGNTWTREAGRQRRVETWCGGPYPAVDGRSLKIKIKSKINR